MKNFTYYILIFLIPFFCNCSNNKNNYNQQIGNLVALTKSYGYIRYFHPLNESSEINWNKFLFNGISRIVSCKNNDELRDSLTNLFKPISDSVDFLTYKPTKNEVQTYQPTDTLIFHQYWGIKTSDLSYLTFKDYLVKISNHSFIDSSLFDIIPNYKENYCQLLIPGLFINFPLVRKYNPQQCAKYNFNQLISNDSNLPISQEQIKVLADIITFWNIVQHFYPYHTESGMNWEQTLTSIIGMALNDPEGNHPEKYIFMLGKEMKDGHFMIINHFKQGFYLPINVRLLNTNSVITESYDTTLFKKGDILQTINNKPVLILIDSAKSYFSGSDEFVNYFTANFIHRSENPDEANVELLRGKEVITIKAKRVDMIRKPKSKILDKKIYYFNLADDNCNIDTLISIAGNNDAIILDWRDGSGLLPVLELFQHMTEDTLLSPFRFMTPQIVYPDHKFVTYYEHKQSILPLKPRIKTKIVILSSPSNISSHESIIKLAQQNSLATVIGETTGGVNGVINYTTLPSGFVVRWTGMKAINLDGSQHHLKGIKPNLLVTPTLEGSIAGKDEVLDKALEYLRKE